jgi:orotate phosphoribosyltransferase-like protein
MKALEIVELVANLIKRIAELAKQGVSDEEIKERLFAPGEVGSELLAAVKRREEAGREFLGR